jgi:hypothetical protein
MIGIDKYFVCNDDFNSPYPFFMEACLQLPKGSYTVNKGTHTVKSSFTKKENTKTKKRSKKSTFYPEMVFKNQIQ